MAGAIAVASWAPYDFWPLAILAYATLARLVITAGSPLKAGLFGLVFGLTLHGVGQSWVYPLLHTRVGMSGLGAAASVGLFVGYLALFTALPCALAARLGASPSVRLAAFAGCLTVGEWARTLFFNGFSGLSYGYALIDTPIAGLAATTGVYGLSLVGYATSAFLAGAVDGAVSPRTVLASTIGMIVLWVSGGLIARVDWVADTGTRRSYVLLQTRIDSRGPPAALATLDTHVTRAPHAPTAPHAALAEPLLRTLESHAADLIIAGEGALGGVLGDLPESTLTRLRKTSRQTGSDLLLGVATLGSDGGLRNSLIHIAPNEQTLPRYDKVRLLPFGEYVPYGYGAFTSRLGAAHRDLTPGSASQSPLSIKAQRLGVLLCSEELLASRARASLPDATLLVSAANLGWFRDGPMPERMLQIARMRSLEVGRPMLRAGNFSVAAHIDHRGRMVDRLDLVVAGELRGVVRPTIGMTPFGRYGDALAIALALALLFCARLSGQGYSRRAQPQRARRRLEVA